ncbi:DUF3772 domain-containing protein [Yoonia sp.]|uniref:DUF3772 domain-containing protein n=1 Tax=Yoonia sp. TaxID=2212373 RepID=UPI0026014E91|nr:DUF3772 domain-containing protein [Yoonia sp.]
MIRHLLIVLAVLVWPLSVAAQDVAEDVVAEQQGPPQELAPQSPVVFADNADWEILAQRAEELAERGDGSRLALTRLRAELVVWRDKFTSRTTLNAGRIATVDAQIAALGPAPENDAEAAEVAARRDALTMQRHILAAPAMLAEEAHARADGLIGEIDAQLLQRQTAELTARGSSPLSLGNLSAATTAIWETIRGIGAETVAGLKLQIGTGRLRDLLPRAAFLLAVAIVLLGMGRRRITAWRTALESHEGWLLPLWLFMLSLGQIIVPVAGLFTLRLGLETLNIFGLRGSAVIAALPSAGFVVIFAWWLGRQVFPVGENAGYLGYDAKTRAAGRRYGVALAWVLAVASLFDAALQTLDIVEGARAAIAWPVLVLMGLLLWRLGRTIRTKPLPVTGETVSQGRLRGLMGKLCTMVAVVSPVVAAFGYTAAGRALMIPGVISLALFGVILVLQRTVHDLSKALDEDESRKGPSALLPVLISFGLYVISLPVFALIWGASVDDLREVWAQFREGFAIGDSRISPTDFLTFAMVFSLGYLLTRFIQGTLRKSVLPRTRMDLGGQNAIIAGFGYVGIILAAIIAITSAGIDLSNLAIVAGALSVGIGFGLQNIVSNFVSGIILLIERPISEGDWIEVGTNMGYVRAISVRSTRIETFDRTDVIIPNADLVSGQVTNWTRGNLIGRVIVPVGVAYGTDTDKVTKILQDIADAHPLVVMNPPPAVLFRGFGADSLDFEIRAILRDVNYVVHTKSEMNHEIAKKFAEAGIEIPFAQRDIWLRNPEVLQGGKS